MYAICKLVSDCLHAAKHLLSLSDLSRLLVAAYFVLLGGEQFSDKTALPFTILKVLESESECNAMLSFYTNQKFINFQNSFNVYNADLLVIYLPDKMPNITPCTPARPELRAADPGYESLGGSRARDVWQEFHLFAKTLQRKYSIETHPKDRLNKTKSCFKKSR